MIVRRMSVVTGLLVVAALATQEPAARSVPPKDAKANVVPATFRAQLVVDNRFPPKVKPALGVPVKDEDRDPRDRTGKMHCLVCEHGPSPVVAVFVRGDLPKDAGDGLSKLLKGTNALLPKYRADKLAAFAMFLKLEGGTKTVPVKNPVPGGPETIEVDLEYPHDEKRAEKVAEVERYFDVVKTDNVPFGLAADKSASVTAFAIGDATPVTVVIYNRLRMVQRWELKADELTDAKVAEILAATETMIRGKK